MGGEGGRFFSLPDTMLTQGKTTISRQQGRPSPQIQKWSGKNVRYQPNRKPARTKPLHVKQRWGVWNGKK
jgi:hypothetical protein